MPTTSVGNSATFAMLAKKVIIELNLNMPTQLEGLHDVFFPTYRPHRLPIPLISPEQRIGLPYIPVDPEKIAAIVITQQDDSPSNALPPDEETRAIAGHLIDFLKHEVKVGRLPYSLAPLQSGIGTIANAVMHGLIDSPFHDLKMYSEVLQDSAIELLDSGKMVFASASSITWRALPKAATPPASSHFQVTVCGASMPQRAEAKVGAAQAQHVLLLLALRLGHHDH